MKEPKPCKHVMAYNTEIYWCVKCGYKEPILQLAKMPELRFINGNFVK